MNRDLGRKDLETSPACKNKQKEVEDKMFTIIQAGGVISDDLRWVGNFFKRYVENDEKLLDDLRNQYGIRPSIIGAG
jgi:hypothetical protein